MCKLRKHFIGMAIVILLSSCGKKVVILPPPLIPVTNPPNQALAEKLASGIEKFHEPFGTIMDPVFEVALSTSSPITDYQRAGDSAIWTGHYLAAQSYRYAVTKSSEALADVWETLRAVAGLIDITEKNYLARYAYPVDSPFDASFHLQDKKRNFYPGFYNGKNYTWVAGTSRDQYSGVFFGLGACYQMVDDPHVRAFVGNHVTKLLEPLLRDFWTAIEPNGKPSTSFIGQAVQQLNFTQIGRTVNPARFQSEYEKLQKELTEIMDVSLRIETKNIHNSYFKFNLSYINFFNLLTLEEETSRHRANYLAAYNLLRNATKDHGNPHFNMIDRAIYGPNPTRDEQTVNYLAAWMLRPEWQVSVNNDGRFEVCKKGFACQPLPIADRPTTDFLWQRDPFIVSGGGDARIHNAGIDYLLPYWMARYYGILDK